MLSCHYLRLIIAENGLLVGSRSHDAFVQKKCIIPGSGFWTWDPTKAKRELYHLAIQSSTMISYYRRQEHGGKETAYCLWPEAVERRQSCYLVLRTSIFSSTNNNGLVSPVISSSSPLLFSILSAVLVVIISAASDAFSHTYCESFKSPNVLHHPRLYSNTFCSKINPVDYNSTHNN